MSYPVMLLIYLVQKRREFGDLCLNTNLQVLPVHMIFSTKIFNDVVDYVKKVEGVKQVGQAKLIAKKSRMLETL